MNRTTVFSLVAAIALPLAGAPAASARMHQPGSAKLTVNFPNWEHYTDIKDSFSATEAGQQAVLDQFKRALEQIAASNVPDGDHLTMTFADIDLAGEYEPWHGASWDDVRIVKDIYPPRFKFSYQLTGRDGQVIKHGNESITDLSFTMRLTIDRSEPLRFEKEVMRDWMGPLSRL